MSLTAYVDTLLPAWMRRSSRAHWTALANTVSHVVDGVIEGLYQGRLAALPGMLDEPGMGGFESADALPLLARDRRLIRGPTETVFEHAARLRVWRATWRQAGTAAGFLGALRAVMAPATPLIRVVSSAGVWWSLLEDGTLELRTTEGVGLTFSADGLTVMPDATVAHPWDWDGKADKYRIWPIIYAPTHTPYLAAKDGQWGDGLSPYRATPAGTIGTTAPRNYVEMARGITADWKPLGMACSHIIVTFDPASFDPATASPGANMPDGTWEFHGRIVDGGGGQRIRERARYSEARYWKGTV